MEKITVTELLKYYVDRYDLPTDASGNVDEANNDGLKPYYSKMSRILKETPIGEITLWDAIKPEKGKRQISIEEFEKLCFPRWRDYIRKNFAGCHDAGALQADDERYRALFEEEYRWKTIAAEQAEQIRSEQSLELNIPNLNDDTEEYPVDDQAISAKGHEMMIEALYDLFFERFKWDALEMDMRAAEILKSNYDVESFHIPELEKAYARVTSFRNYIGDRRK